MLQHSICAFLAPAVVSAMAFPWAGPEPTLIVPAEDNWSPVPTLAPNMGALELFKRAAGDNTCGYVSGESTRSLTCNNVNYVCATNTYYGVHGCCDPDGISTCSIPTTCIAYSDLSASCTGDCSTNEYIAKCTDTAAPYCYEWRYVYSTRTVMTEHGCAESAFTISVQRTYTDGLTTDSDIFSETEAPVTITITASDNDDTTTTTATSSPTSGTAESQTAGPTQSSEPEKKSSTNIGAIVGGVVGGLVGVGAIAFGIIFLILRNRKAKQNAANTASGVNQPMMGGQGPAPGVTEYKPQAGGYNPNTAYNSPGPQYTDPAAGGYYGQENKPGFQQMGVPGQEMHHPYSPPTSPAPQYSGPAPVQPVPFGVAEAGGNPVQHPGQPSQPTQQQHVYEAP